MKEQAHDKQVQEDCKEQEQEQEENKELPE